MLLIINERSCSCQPVAPPTSRSAADGWTRRTVSQRDTHTHSTRPAIILGI